MSISRTCVRCLQPLPDHLSDGSCPSCGTPFRLAAETPAGVETQVVLPDSQFDNASNRTVTHIPATLNDAQDRGTALSYYPDIPNHTDFEIVGRGGMGTVYRAIQRPADRAVAIKVMNGFANDETMRERFVCEIRALAKLRHPGVVTIHEVGTCSHGPYFTMEYATGGSLSDRIKKGGLDDREAARIVAEAADAVHEAHREGIIHRDIKPSNILLDDAGRVKVSDFGLAKDVTADRTLTQGGVTVGTVPYMAPEQASGDPRRITKLSDVYSLGSTLFHLLTGRPPRDSRTVPADIRRIQKEPAPSARAARPDLCSDLDAILQRCMALEPQYRFPTAAALASDLRKWRDGEEIETKPPTRGEKALRFLRRHRVAAAVVLLLPFLAAATVAVVREMEPQRQIERAWLRGESVDWMDREGRPKLLKWRLGESQFVPSPVNDGTKSFSSGWVSVASLIDRPPTDRYRIEADLRHIGGSRTREDQPISSNPVSSLGLFCGYQGERLEGGVTVHYLVSLDFHDKVAPELPNERTAHLRARAYLQIPGETMKKFHTDFSPSIPYTVSSDRFGDWRAFRIEVSPDGLAASLEQDGRPAVAVRVPAAKIDAKMRVLAATIRGQHPVAAGSGLQGWQPQSPFGLFGVSVTAGVKTLRVSPLEPPASDPSSTPRK